MHRAGYRSLFLQRPQGHDNCFPCYSAKIGGNRSMNSSETCRNCDTTGQPVATEIFRSSPYEYALTAESTVQVFISGHVSPEAGDQKSVADAPEFEAASEAAR